MLRYALLAAGCCSLVLALAIGARAATLYPSLELTEPAPQAEARFGSALATGDINGDGVADLVVGSAGLGAGNVLNGGEVNIFLGPSFAHAQTLFSPSTAPRFGEALASGDVNGDGFDDVIASSRYADVGPSYKAGEVFVFFGPSLSQWQRLEDPVPQAGASFGISVAAGDTNDDGFAEVVVGAWDSNHSGYTKAGEAFVFTAPSLTAVTTLRSPMPQVVGDFGVSSAVGDFDGDGDGDVIIGAWTADSIVPDTGQAFVFYGPSYTSVTTLDPPAADVSNMGRAVAAGDIDGDGDAEVVAGANGEAILYEYTTPSSYASRRLTLPSAWGSGQVPGVAMDDANNDGLADILIGAPKRASSGTASAGGAMLYVSGGSASYELELPVVESSDYGWRAALVPGFAVVGAPWQAVGGNDKAGRVHLTPLDDADQDGWLAINDNCPSAPNTGQETESDRDLIDLSPRKVFYDATWPMSDNIGDACDTDDDNDGIDDAREAVLPDAGCPQASTATSATLRDSDGDLSLDGAECILGTDPASAASSPALIVPNDADRDGLPAALEAALGTNPSISDSDGDRMSDGLEVRGYNSDPLLPDSDGDGCGDNREIASINADRAVTSIDLSQVAQSFGLAGSQLYFAHFDVNRDGKVSSIDLSIVAQQFGLC